MLDFDLYKLVIGNHEGEPGKHPRMILRTIAHAKEAPNLIDGFPGLNMHGVLNHSNLTTSQANSSEFAKEKCLPTSRIGKTALIN